MNGAQARGFVVTAELDFFSQRQRVQSFRKTHVCTLGEGSQPTDGLQLGCVVRTSLGPGGVATPLQDLIQQLRGRDAPVRRRVELINQRDERRGGKHNGWIELCREPRQLGDCRRLRQQRGRESPKTAPWSIDDAGQGRLIGRVACQAEVRH
jgi:hypothetical protein